MLAVTRQKLCLYGLPFTGCVQTHHPFSVGKIRNINDSTASGYRHLGQGCDRHPGSCIVDIYRHRAVFAQALEELFEFQPVHTAVAALDAFFEEFFPDRMIVGFGVGISISAALFSPVKIVIAVFFAVDEDPDDFDFVVRCWDGDDYQIESRYKVIKEKEE